MRTLRNRKEKRASKSWKKARRRAQRCARGRDVDREDVDGITQSFEGAAAACVERPRETARQAGDIGGHEHFAGLRVLEHAERDRHRQAEEVSVDQRGLAGGERDLHAEWRWLGPAHAVSN